MASSRNSKPRVDRRGPDRPRNGDTKPCPHCGQGTIEFNERSRIDGAAVPAWTCDNPACSVPYDVVRSRPADLTSEELVRSSKQVRAGAIRNVMKSRARAERGARRVARSERTLRKPKT
jgi:hypothetical protein